MKAIAPGKLILSGEHAVVYGKPALAMAIDRSAQAIIEPTVEEEIAISLHNYDHHEKFRMRAMREFQKRAKNNYELFLEGELGIRDVLVKPIELIQFAFITLLDGLHLKMEQGLNINLSSNIPIGCGLGSSAATVLSEIRAVGHFFRVDFRPDWHYKYSLEAENMQHGYASGVDSYVSLHGGCVRFQDGVGEKVALPSVPIFIVQTGTPDTTTGECVTQVAGTFETSGIWDDFEDVTRQMSDVIGSKDIEAMQGAIRQNHQLLTKIGVVPERVQQFIRDVEQWGGAAKVCGAGAVSGDAGGIVMVISETPPVELCQRYGYELSAVRGDPLGVRIIGK
ncbi:MAG: mevalonate kinase [Verrucomicrobia bacterium]|jgi:mevalonate kinase|nr:mevalonate kinase [Verrucomicrobiota bacterium]